jgi:hypothetical protein
MKPLHIRTYGLEVERIAIQDFTERVHEIMQAASVSRETRDSGIWTTGIREREMHSPALSLSHTCKRKRSSRAHLTCP